MQGQRFLIVSGAGNPQSAAVAVALIAGGAKVVCADMPISQKPEMAGAWADDWARVRDPQNTYGPPKKGRGGKVRKW